jgi:putative SbcD/Mre11-related phosphoesterase
MKLSDIQPITNEPALFIKNKQILVVADLHIGIESQLKEQGINTSFQAQKMINHLLLMCKKQNPKEIILLGDIKHNIPSATFQERRDISNFLEQIKEFGIVHIIPGNHDGFIKKLSPEEIIIHPSDGLIIENIGFFHGHRWPNEDIMRCEQIIMGHTHPTIMFTDRLEYKTFEPCWVKGIFLKNKIKEKYPKSTNPEILIMPTFNPLCGGIAINQEGVTGPIGKIIDIQNSQIYLIDGTYLGKINDII